MVIAEVVNALLHGGDPTRMAGTVMVGPLSIYFLPIYRIYRSYVPGERVTARAHLL